MVLFTARAVTGQKMTAFAEKNSESQENMDSHLLKLSEGEERFERKFYLPELTKYEVQTLIKYNPAAFKEIFYERHVNNLYLDTSDLRNYRDNVVGAQHRQKVRIRWYGELFGEISQPTLEIKVKNGLVGTKFSYRLPALHITPGFRFSEWLDFLGKKKVPGCIRTWLATFEPALINRYTRQYYLSGDKVFRATIDSEMRFGSLMRKEDMFLTWAEGSKDTVLELKYVPENDLKASEITSVFPFRVTKSSKYVIGIDSIRVSCGRCPEFSKK